MAKKLCKLRRHDIADNLGNISKLVAESQYLCRSCARSASEKSVLCKPVSIAAPKPAASVSQQESVLTKKDIKESKKSLKKQKKQQKKLTKVLKKQGKLVRKHQKLEEQYSRLNLSLLNMESGNGQKPSLH